MLLTGGTPPMVARHDWAALRELWPALARARQGDKASVIKLMSQLQDTTVTNMQSFTINLSVSAHGRHRTRVSVQVPPECALLARALHAQSQTHVPPAHALPDEQALRLADTHEQQRNEHNERDYYALVDEIFVLCNNSNNDL